MTDRFRNYVTEDGSCLELIPERTELTLSYQSKSECKHSGAILQYYVELNVGNDGQVNACLFRS